MVKKFSILLPIALVIGLSLQGPGCSNDNQIKEKETALTIFTTNDMHAQIDHFAKIKYIIDQEREKNPVLVVCGGDTFSGNPVVDNHEDKGYPIIDLMNEAGYNVTVIGNHEFDYGQPALTDRMSQSEFKWICANVDMGSTGIPQPDPYVTLTAGDFKVTFLGLVETNGNLEGSIPSTHPLKITGITFDRPETVVGQYSQLKEQEGADLYVALTHLGYAYQNVLSDMNLANQFPFFDMIIGGHSHETVNDRVNDIPIFQAGSHTNYLGKIELKLMNREIESVNYTLIDLSTYANADEAVANKIADYNNNPMLDEVIGTAASFHDKQSLGCFYTDAIRAVMEADLSFQNPGGIRTELDAGDITKREIFSISPFNNGTVTYDMTVADIETFLRETRAGLYYDGLVISQSGTEIIIQTTDGRILEDETLLKVGLNDYIPSVYNTYFPDNGIAQELTAAETLIYYLQNYQEVVDYSGCSEYFRYSQ